MSEDGVQEPLDHEIQEHAQAAAWPRLVWHYCSLATFEKIIASGQLRLMEATWQKDGDELEYGEQMALRQLRGRLSWREIQSRKVPFESSEKRRPHVVCFTACSDSPLHWKRYANEETGVAIGIDLRATGAIPNYPQRLFFRGEHRVMRDWGLFWYPMLYNQGEQARIARLAVERLAGLARGPNGTWDPDEKFWVDEFAMAMAFKRPKFAGEREHRLAFGHMDTCRGRGSLGGFTTVDGGRSYTPLNLEAGRKSILAAVRLGPKCCARPDTVRSLLQGQGFTAVRTFRSRARWTALEPG